MASVPALLYAFLAILIWPRAQGASLASGIAQASSVAEGSPLGRWSRLAWLPCGPPWPA
jgi:hypothetical protein